jgi:hypothetical protein
MIEYFRKIQNIFLGSAMEFFYLDIIETSSHFFQTIVNTRIKHLQKPIQDNKYSISCGISAGPAPGQSDGPGTGPALTAKRPAHIGLIKATINT